ncbi:catechol 1,2-dioxygenase [Altererythrobacter atlanticus]|uniref:Hydroxyquinol 1,2-dioxygenase n=1 Tax=Croceibacterium atlanticum TaxID=1267766 RepID=A0A0F7KVX8_9SPHN|nr:intradiol ring-cleavage dioxygenase [Croceibacterium atlanticum]AKH42915.1 Hydroxyquinol 1,2-dioxygenase [Croceibacterium atlanticum]MBB5731695.1 catechol 1,2-dioxygenase [Croceibacterium atlanticum]
MSNLDIAAENPYFDQARSAALVNGRMGEQTPERLREIMTVLVNHLHAAIKEAEITEEEWMAGIRFLTDVGHMCTDWRQEFILLSDVLGVSMLVDAVSNERPEAATANTVLGPFYVQNSPHYPNGHNICLDGKGEPLVISGRVVDEAGRPVAGAEVDVWQTNDEGFYDVQQKGIQPDYNLRGVFTTDEQGEYWLKSVKPRHYPIPHDGPVGRLLTALGRHPNRPAHIHFIVRGEGFQTVTTHIFAPDCPFLASDPVFGVKKSLIADFRRVEDQALAEKYGLAAPFWHVEWDFVLVAA